MAISSRPNPQKRNILIGKLARAPWWLLIAAILILIFALRVSDQDPYPIIWDKVQDGILTTIEVSVLAYGLALLLGLIIALLRRSRNILVYQLVTLYVEAVRGVPTLVLVYYMALAGIPKLIEQISYLGQWLTWLNITVIVTNDLVLHFTFESIGRALESVDVRDFDNKYRAVIGLAISYSAFLSEVFRAGIESIGVGQREAASSLGMTRWQMMRLVILPQAIRVVIPPLANDFIAMLKESSLVSLVGAKDITQRGQTYGSSTFKFFEAYNVVALTYLVMTLSLSMAVKLLELHLARGRDHA